LLHRPATDVDRCQSSIAGQRSVLGEGKLIFASGTGDARVIPPGRNIKASINVNAVIRAWRRDKVPAPCMGGEAWCKEHQLVVVGKR